LITNAAFADGSNFSNAGFQNIGSFTTKGIELNLNAQIIKNKILVGMLILMRQNSKEELKN